jgi:hypothetical protein
MPPRYQTPTLLRPSQNLKGTVTLAGKKEERQVPCLQYRYEFAVKDQRIPREGLPSTVPPGFDHGTLAMTFQGTSPILLREAKSVSGARLREIGGALKAGVMCRKIPLDEALAGICHGEKLAFSADEVRLVANRTTMSSVE